MLKKNKICYEVDPRLRYKVAREVRNSGWTAPRSPLLGDSLRQKLFLVANGWRQIMVDKIELEEDDVDDVMDDESDTLEDDEDVSLVASEQEQPLEDFSIASRQRLREELSGQIAEFLARGGKINEVPSNIGNGYTKKVSPEYGSRPI